MIHSVAHGTDTLHDDVQIGEEATLESSGDSGLNLASRGPILKNNTEAELLVLKIKGRIQIEALLKGVSPELINDQTKGGFIHQVLESVLNGLMSTYGTFELPDQLVSTIVIAQINAIWAKNQAEQSLKQA